MISLPPSGRTYELTRLSLYRTGLAGTYAKYRFVPRSAIFDYDELRDTVLAYRGDTEAQSAIARLWQRHGAPSRRILDAFLAAGADLDRSGRHAAPAQLEAALAQPCALARVDPAAVRDLADARRRLLEAWLGVCSPRSALGRIRDTVELAVCFVLRRVRQYLHAAHGLVRSTDATAGVNR